MTFKLNLRPEIGAQLRESAEASGLSVEQYLAKLIEESVPVRRSEAALALLDAWDKEDATDDREELEKRRREWSSLKASLAGSAVNTCTGGTEPTQAIRPIPTGGGSAR